MLFVKLILDNKIASPDTPEQFVRRLYLTAYARNDLVTMEVIQGDLPEGEKDAIH